MDNQLIVYLGWGSLIWNQGALPIRGEWWYDGPFLPVEYARQSSDGRLTLVTHDSFCPIRVFWSIADVQSIEEGIRELRLREGISEKNEATHIGFWSSETKKANITHAFIEKISHWAYEKGINGVIWTALPPKFNDEAGRIPSADEAVLYLKSLPYAKQQNAKNYIIQTPAQIDTPYRRKFVSELNFNRPS
jgi:hypothetical protein